MTGHPVKKKRDDWLLWCFFLLHDARDARELYDATVDPDKPAINGHPMPIDDPTYRAFVHKLLFESKRRQEHLAAMLLAGTITMEAWQEGTARNVAALWLVLAALAYGSFNAHPDVGDPDAPGSFAFSVGRLQNFAEDLEKGEAGSDAQVKQRAGQYVDSAWSGWEKLRKDAAQEEGYTEERNVLGDAHHCNECPELTRQGWQPIGTMPLPGSRECFLGCKCHMEYQ